MKTARLPGFLFLISIAALLGVGGCNAKNQAANPPTASGPQPQPAATAAPSPTAGETPPSLPAPQPGTVPAPPPQRAVYRIPARRDIRVRLGETLDSKTSEPGQRFTATVVSPVIVDGNTVIPAGSPASGKVIEATAQGRFKGKAVLALRLEEIRVRGRSYSINTSTVDRIEQGKGKRSATLIGGGAGLGAIIGGLAGGGKGVLIGGLAGGGAGTAGTAFTGNKQVVIPAETVLSFRLENSLEIPADQNP